MPSPVARELPHIIMTESHDLSLPDAMIEPMANEPPPMVPWRDQIDVLPFVFTGSGGEYFRVWLVNVLLSLITLGFYTPFARRRTAQYFYNHTLLDDNPFEFVGQQRKMVLGFLIMVALYLAYKLAQETGQSQAASLLLLGFALLLPWLWGSAMRFRLSSTRWRGIRLAFTASWVDVYKASWPVFAVAALWIGIIFALTADIADEPAQPPATGSGAATVQHLVAPDKAAQDAAAPSAGAGDTAADEPAAEDAANPPSASPTDLELPKLPAMARRLVSLGVLLTVLGVIRLEYNYLSHPARLDRRGCL